MKALAKRRKEGSLASQTGNREAEVQALVDQSRIEDDERHALLAKLCAAPTPDQKAVVQQEIKIWHSGRLKLV